MMDPLHVLDRRSKEDVVEGDACHCIYTKRLVACSRLEQNTRLITKINVFLWHEDICYHSEIQHNHWITHFVRRNLLLHGAQRWRVYEKRNERNQTCGWGGVACATTAETGWMYCGRAPLFYSRSRRRRRTRRRRPIIYSVGSTHNFNWLQSCSRNSSEKAN